MRFTRANTLNEALDVLADAGDRTRVLAGGTDVMIQLARKEIYSDVLLHIEPIKELARIGANGEVTIGSLVCHRKLATSFELIEGHSAIRTAANLVGGWQTQIAGTIGGNICNASPAADLAAPLLIHGAAVTLASRKRGERVLPLQDFLLGRRTTAREPDELAINFRLEEAPVHSSDTYLKVGRRSATEVAIVGLAVRLSLGEDCETITDVRIASCSVGPVPKRATAAEAILRGETLSKETIAAAGNALVSESAPIDDIRASAWYRNTVLPGVLNRALTQCQESICSRERLAS